MNALAIVTDSPSMRRVSIVLIGLFSLYMVRSMFQSWRRLRTSRRRRAEETYDIARFVFGLITAGIIFWLLLTPPPHQLTHALSAALVLWACAYLALFVFLAVLKLKKRA
jgi:heme A synthase